MKNIAQVGATFTGGHIATPVCTGHTPVSNCDSQSGSTFTGVIPTGGISGGSDSVGFDGIIIEC